MLDGRSQHYDLHRKRLMLSELLRPESRVFAVAYQVALFEFRPLFARVMTPRRPPDAPSRRLLHMSLANYAAGAILMPYAGFLAAAERHRYDIDRLCAEFGASVEQVAHRMTTLGRSGARGIPFFMLGVDAAGNVSKRFAGESFPFSRFGGTCPRWNLHASFRTPGRVATQIVETPDGQRFFTISRTVDRSVRLDPREAASLPSVSAATLSMRPGWSMPTGSISGIPMSHRSARPASSARASAARNARLLRPAAH